MSNSITRLVALACFLGLALALIWIGLAHTPARESNPTNTKPITARERTAMLYTSPSSPLVAAYRQASKQRAASRPTPNHLPSKQLSIAQAWHAHEGAKVNPVPVALPEGTAFVRGIPAHPSRVVARMRPEMSRNALANALDGVGASIAAEPNANGWLTVDLAPPTAEDEALGAESTLLTRMKTLQATGAQVVDVVDMSLEESFIELVRPHARRQGEL